MLKRKMLVWGMKTGMHGVQHGIIKQQRHVVVFSMVTHAMQLASQLLDQQIVLVVTVHSYLLNVVSVMRGMNKLLEHPVLLAIVIML